MADSSPTPSWRNFLDHRARLLVVLSTAATLAGWLGNLHWPLELLSHFIAWFAAGTFVAALILALCGGWRWAAAAALLCVIQAWVPLSWYLPARDAGPVGAPNCRILLANVLSQNLDTAAFLALAAALDPDIICVQEVTDRWREALKPLEVAYPVQGAVPRGDNFGIALYSRLPGPLPEIVFQREHEVPAMALRFTAGGREVNLLNLHTLPPIGGALAARRNAQLEGARKWLDAQAGPAVLIGDLNLTMYSPVYRRLVRGAGVRNARAGWGPLGTWPAWVPVMRLPLDQCLVKGIGISECRTVHIPGSDHLGLVVEFTVPAE